MSGLNQLLNDHLELVYLLDAQKEVQMYMKLTDNEKLTDADKFNLINEVFTLTKRSARVKGTEIEPDSLRKIQSSFRKGFEQYNLQLKLLELLLCIIEKNLGVKSPAIGQKFEIKQDIPLLRPDDFLMSRLQSNVYDLIENETEIANYLDNPNENRAIVILWLVLKEGINRSINVQALLSNECFTYRIENHWFIEFKHQRYWLSSTAELLLTAYWNDTSISNTSIMIEVNKLLHKKRLLPNNYSIRFNDLKSMLRSEFILNTSASEYSICQATLPTTSVSQNALFRLLCAQRVAHNATTVIDNQQEMPVRQKVAWLSACSNSAVNLRKKTTLQQKEMTTAEQLLVIEQFTKPLIKAALKKSGRISKLQQHELRAWLETNDMVKATPWCWLIISWLYHLLKHGGKHKKRLRLSTIKSYVTYVAAPFIQEFSGCSPKMMEHLDWAEKLNIVAENITSTKKAYVLYFAEYLIESGLITNLCLSDIDIPSVSNKVNANLITQHEADKIIQECDTLDTPISKLAKLLFCLGFYSGLRRGEISGLQFADFTIAGHHYVNLHVRPNKYRELKSSESSRNLPLESLWPEEHIQFLSWYLNTSRTKLTHSKSMIFSEVDALNNAFTLLTSIIKIVTGEPSIRFHHCRHSFCNWTWIRLHYSTLAELSDFHFCQHPFFSQVNCENLCGRLSISSFSRKKLWALSGLLGHSSPDVTTSSYFHLSEFVRRNAFAPHSPSSFLLRRFWGQRIHITEQSKLGTVPNSKQQLTRVFPREHKPEIDDSCISTAIGRLVVIPDLELKQNISLCSVWKIICLSAEGHETKSISYTLGIDEKSVLSVLQFDGQITQASLRRSKYDLEALVNYTKLNKGNIKAIDTLIKLFEAAERKGLIPLDFNLEELVEVLADLVGSKDNLIRTYNKNAALLLLKLMQLIGLTERHVKIKWYFPSEKYCNTNQLDKYKKHLNFWHTVISEKIFPNIQLEVIIPKAFAAHIKSSSTFKVTISDDGKYLKYHPPGTISIHVLQAKFDNERYDENGNKVFIPQRTRAFISFLRLLAIYIKVSTG